MRVGFRGTRAPKARSLPVAATRGVALEVEERRRLAWRSNSASEERQGGEPFHNVNCRSTTSAGWTIARASVKLIGPSGYAAPSPYPVTYVRSHDPYNAVDSLPAVEARSTAVA